MRSGHLARSRERGAAPRRLTLVLEELHRAFVLLRLFARVEGPQFPALAGLGIDLPRVESVLPRLELADHRCLTDRKARTPRHSSSPGVGSHELGFTQDMAFHRRQE